MLIHKDHFVLNVKDYSGMKIGDILVLYKDYIKKYSSAVLQVQDGIWKGHYDIPEKINFNTPVELFGDAYLVVYDSYNYDLIDKVEIYSYMIK